MLKNLLLISLGGAIGACSRYLLVRLSLYLWPAATSALGTLIVNLLGCLIIGALLGAAQRTTLLTPAATLFLITGFCGALTTFSTFSADTIALADSGRLIAAVAYAALSVALGLLLTLLARKIILIA